MRRDAARELANNLMREHGLFAGEDVWRLRFNDRLRRVAARVKFGPNVVELGEQHMALNDLVTVTNTVLHEIAHVKAGPKVKAHGAVWRAWARRVGAEPARTCPVATVTPAYKWQAECCGKTLGFYARPRREYVCRDCREVLVFEQVR